MPLLEIQPVLAVRNVSESIRFYLEKLGFTIAFQDSEDPRYAGVRRDHVEIHLQWHQEDDFTEGDAPLFRIKVEDPDSLFNELLERKALPEGKTISDTDWGTREFGLYDPDKNGLIFYRDLH